MARTWSLTDTLLLGQSPIPPFTSYFPAAKTRVIGNDNYTAIFFDTGNSLTSCKVWKWDGSNLLEIAGDFFRNQTGTFGGSGNVMGLSWFKNNLYAAYDVGKTIPDGGKIARWNGTTGTGDNWTDVYIAEDEASGWGKFSNYGLGAGWSNKELILDTDCRRLGTIFFMGTKSRMATSEDGESWSLQSLGGDYSDPAPYFVGREQGSSYGSLLCLEGYPPPGIGQCLVIEPQGESSWSTLTASTTGTNSVLVGYGDGYSFFMTEYPIGGGLHEWELESSTDWGVTFTSANGPGIQPDGSNLHWAPETIFKRFNNTDILWSVRGGTQVYAWDSDSLEIIADGTTAEDIFGFFRLNGDLCALCGTAGTGTAGIYCSGSVADDVAEFYQGAGSLDFKVNLSFPGVAPGGMAVKDKLDTVVFGSDQGYKEMVDYANYPYEAIFDMDDGMPTGVGISAMEWL